MGIASMRNQIAAAFPLLVLLAAAAAKGTSADLEVVNEWRFLDWEFPSYSSNAAELVRAFRPENAVFTGLELTRDRLFVAVPRLRDGVPATLNYVPRRTPPGSAPRLRPFPHWGYHSAGAGVFNCSSGLVSVYRMRLDSCGRLWVVDSGVRASLDDFERVCDPKLVIFDLRSDSIAKTVLFPRQVLRPSSLLTNLVIDETSGSCDSAVAYISDTAAPGLVVYDGRGDRTWRIQHPSMFPDPDFSDYVLDGERFSLMDGIVGLAMSPGLGLLYFQPLATDRLFSVPLQALKNGPLAEGEDLPVALVGKKSSQGVAVAVDQRDETLFFSPVMETALAAWNPLRNDQRVLAYDPVRIQFPTEIRLDPQDGSVWMLSTRFHRFFRRSVSGDEANLRILRVRPYEDNGS